jgi:predicted nucleotidyltransferase
MKPHIFKMYLKLLQKVDSVILFGSRAKGTFSNGSDIDIALKGENIVLNDVLDLLNALDELLLPYKFDIVIFDRIEDDVLKEHINRVGISLT